jgi:hypothetical protein
VEAGENSHARHRRNELGHLVTGEHKYGDPILQVGGWTQGYLALYKNYCCEIQRIENYMVYRQVWKNLLRKAMAQKGLFADDDYDYDYDE